MVLSDKVRDVLFSELQALGPKLLIMTDPIGQVECKAVADVLTEAIEDILTEKLDDLYDVVQEHLDGLCSAVEVEFKTAKDLVST